MHFINVIPTNTEHFFLMKQSTYVLQCLILLLLMLLLICPLVILILIFLVSAPTVSVTSTPRIVGQAVSLDCSVTTVASVSNSAVNVTWRSNGVVLQRVTGVGTANPMGNTVVYIHSYIISRLTTTDDGRAYQCEVSISATPPVNATDNIILDVIG